MICARCQHSNDDSASFCEKCGAKLAARTCETCHAALKPSANFCSSCGTHVAATAGTRPGRELRAYTPKHLADKILNVRGALEGERKQVTVLFADVKGSMELAERLDPEEWHRILDRFFQILTEGVHRFEGTVNQYTGDGIMALFGAPIAHEDHAQRACYAALHLCDGLRDYAQELRRQHGVDLSARIGLNTGDVVVGRIGDDLRMDYTAQGHTVGLAQRLEQLAEPGLPYASEATARVVDGYFDLTNLGEFAVKGVAEPIRAFGLRGIGPLRTRLELSRVRGFSTFVGRSEEFGILETALERAIDGTGGIVGIVADAGVGKSRLCLEFVERCRARGIPVYEGHCVSYGAAVPLLPVREMLRGFFDVADTDAPLCAREKITGRLLVLDESLSEFLPVIFDLMGVADPADHAPPGDSSMRERQVVAFVHRLIRARSDREPAVMFIDDAHWIDGGSDGVIAQAIEVVPSTRTLFLLNFRPEYTAEWMSRSTYQQLPLRPLDHTAVGQLLDELLGSDASLGPLPTTIGERTGGNPFYVEEFVRALVESGAIEGERGAYRLTRPVAEITVPTTVQNILAGRIDRLAEHEKTVLQCAAVIGHRFPEAILRRVCDVPDGEVTAALAALRRAELIYEESLYPDVEYAFRHPLTHEVAERSQLASNRRRVHADVARVLEEAAPAEVGEHAALLAHHWDQADEATPAAIWHRRAAEWIAGTNSLEATRHWVRVRDLSEALDDAALAAELGERSRRLIIEHIWRRGLPQEEAEERLREAEEWARTRNDMRALAGFYDAYGTAAALSYGQLARARELIDEGRRLAKTAGDGALRFSLELRHSLVCDWEGNATQADQAAQAVLALPTEDAEAASALLGYDAPAFTRLQAGVTAFDCGRLCEARIRAEDALRFARERGSVEVAGWALAMLCGILLESGESDAALQAGRKSMAIAEQLQSPLSMALTSLYLSQALIGAGDLASAHAFAERALETSEITMRPLVPHALVMLAEIALQRENRADARELAERAERIADEHGSHDAQLYAAGMLLKLDAAEGDSVALAGAPGRLRRFRETIQETGYRSMLPSVLEVQVAVCERLGDRAGAERTRAELDAVRAEMLTPTTFDL